MRENRQDDARVEGQDSVPTTRGSQLATRHSVTGIFILTLLAIELLDELTFGAREAVWPQIQADLHLDYAQIGLLIGLPNFLAAFIEPFLFILGDVWKRRALVLGGGTIFGLALLATAASGDFWVLLVASIFLSPASGAFVSLSQATLMDSDPMRHEQNMARWTFAGSLGAVGGTLAAGGAALFTGGWRVLFITIAGLTLLTLLFARRFSFPRAQPDGAERVTFKSSAINAARALKRPDVLRWLALLEFSDLMLDVLLGYLALYFADVVGVGLETAALAVGVWIGVGLVGDFLLIPLLERVRGLSYLRLSAGLMLILYPIFLLVPDFWAKLGVLALMGLFNAGWYAILKGQLYSSMPGQSGAVLAVGNVFNLGGSLVPIGLGMLAEQIGLGSAMWLLLAGPVALLVGIPGRNVMRDA
jgi:FSR family fosmidomycin resistance protein-like MFS transporter